MMYQLAYVSDAVGEMTVEDLLALLQTARRKNAERGITGILIYQNGHFAQVLEGDKNKVAELYKKIAADERHTNVNLALMHDVPSREFGNWSMAFASIDFDDVNNIEGLSDFLEEDTSPELIAAQKSKVREFLKLFQALALL